MSSHYKPSYSIEVLKKASNKRFGIVSSEWNSEIIERLLNGAYDFFSKIDINKGVANPIAVISGSGKKPSAKKFKAIAQVPINPRQT